MMVLKLLTHGLDVRPQNPSLSYMVTREIHPTITGAHIRGGTDADATPGIVKRVFGRTLGGNHEMYTRRIGLNDFYDDRSPYYLLLCFIVRFFPWVVDIHKCVVVSVIKQIPVCDLLIVLLKDLF